MSSIDDMSKVFLYKTRRTNNAEDVRYYYENYSHHLFLFPSPDNAVCRHNLKGNFLISILFQDNPIPLLQAGKSLRN